MLSRLGKPAMQPESIIICLLASGDLHMNALQYVAAMQGGVYPVVSICNSVEAGACQYAHMYAYQRWLRWLL